MAKKTSPKAKKPLSLIPYRYLLFMVAASIIGLTWGWRSRQIKDEFKSLKNSVLAETKEHAQSLKGKIKDLKPNNQEIEKETANIANFTKAPGFAYPAAVDGQQIVRHTAYTLSYNEKYEQASWVAYKLSADDLKGKAKRDGEDFREDDLVKTGSATLHDYKGSGYDRGHLAPAGDMKKNAKTMSESFLLSNISPQKPEFNRGIWRILEEKVRVWAARNNELYIVTGPVLSSDLPTIGYNHVAVPDYYYKVILDARLPDVKALAFLMPNENSERHIRNYVVTIDEVEEKTGLDFFPLLPDALEKHLEGQVDDKIWFRSY